MPIFKHNSIDTAYLDEGEGEPILLIHGFASSKDVNWVYPGWVNTLTADGRRVIALDNRGHGQSSKLYAPADYHTSRMAEDAVGLLDYLGIGRADVMGYSMGARITAYMALEHPDRVRSAILAGLGSRLIEGAGLNPAIADALEAPSLDDVVDQEVRTFRKFADQTRSDLRALAACIRGSRQQMSHTEASLIQTPTLVAVGTKDDVAGSASELAAVLPDAVSFDIPGRDHMLAVGDKALKERVLAFLAERP